MTTAFEAGLKAGTAAKLNPRKLNPGKTPTDRDDWLNGYYSAPRLAKKQPKPIDLTPPAFLRLPRPDFKAPLPAFVVADRVGGSHQWAAARDYSMEGIMARIDALIVNKEAPVSVWARDEKRIEFDCYADFETWYRPSIGRFLGANSQATFTDIALDEYKPPATETRAAKPGRKPRGPKAEGEAKPKRERTAKTFDKAGEGKPVSEGSSLAAILRLMIAGKHTMDEIIEKSGVEGGVLSAEDKVLHRIRFVLFRQHGVGHTIDDKGIVRAVLPMDEKAMFKVGKKGAK